MAQLVVHAVDVRSEGADLVPVGDVDVAAEVAAGDLRKALLRAPQRGDDRPREEQAEHEREPEAACADPDQEVA